MHRFLNLRFFLKKKSLKYSAKSCRRENTIYIATFFSIQNRKINISLFDLEGRLGLSSCLIGQKTAFSLQATS
jgi:hypothetical protein